MALGADVKAVALDIEAGTEGSPCMLTFSVTLSSNFDHLSTIPFLFWPTAHESEGPWVGDQVWATATRDPVTGNFVGSIELSPHATSAIYEVRKFVLYDEAGNQIDVTDDQMRQNGFDPTFDFVNPNGDEIAPQVSEVSIGEPQVQDDGSICVEVTVVASEDLSGFGDRAFVELMGPSGTSYFSEVNLSETDGVGVFKFTLPPNAPSGFYDINTIRIYDNALNGRDYYDPAEIGGPAGFELANPNSDAEAPTLVNMQVDGYFDDSGRPTLSYDIQWSDEVSGVANAYLRASLPNGGQNDRWLSLEQGRSTGTIALLSPSAEGVYRISLFATDAAGNRTPWYSAEALGAMGFEAALNVFAPTETAYAGATVQSDDTDSIVFGLGLADTLIGGDGANQMLGGSGNDQLTGGDGDDYVDGGKDDDLIVGGSGAGNDIYIGGEGRDTARYTSAISPILVNLAQGRASGSDIGTDRLSGIEDVIGGQGADSIVGDGQDNLLQGYTGDDLLRGGTGNDTLMGGYGVDVGQGGAGDDTIYIEQDGDSAVELENQGYDRVLSRLDFSLPENVEALTLLGRDELSGTGNELDNSLSGNSAANILAGGAGDDKLDGGAGADVLRGGAGNDTYVIDTAGDRMVEALGEGIDTVKTSASFTLATHFEQLTLTGTGAVNGTGNSAANVITGNAAANVLNGMAGADMMSGGSGSDTYVVDNAGDRAIEASSSGGTDQVKSSVNFTLGAHVEKLYLTGGALRGTGNNLANSLYGNAAANVLDGGLGADAMNGGTGDDTYYVDDVGDKVAEALNAGTDAVRASVSFTLGANVEKLYLAGTALRGTGNSLANSLYGNDAANVLDGAKGADTLNGGAGNDTYVVDNAGDKVVEALNAGADVVKASTDYTLGANVENLILTGTAVSGTGNGLANAITGTSGANILSGDDGADVLSGGLGNDALHGGLGNDDLRGGSGSDVFHFDTALSATRNVDDILDFSAAADSIGLDRSVFRGISVDGTLVASAFHNGSAAHDADDRILYDKATGHIYYDADGTGAAAAVLFATVSPGLTLTSADFIAHP